VRVGVHPRNVPKPVRPVKVGVRKEEVADGRKEVVVHGGIIIICQKADVFLEDIFQEKGDKRTRKKNRAKGLV